MGARLKTNKNNSAFRMCDLKDGQIAVIIDSANYTGRVIQRYKDNCVAIGKSDGHGFTNVYRNTLEVRVLEDGELIEVYNNK